MIEKKALLARLARDEARRLGIEPDAATCQALADSLRAEIGLEDAGETRAWLEDAGLDEAAFAEVVADLAAVLAVEAHYRGVADGQVERHRRFITGRERRLAGSRSVE